ncbi:MAG: hypothetical protein ACJAZ1_003456 [Yoonia sp.]|jgi:hypothetical protein
MDQQPRVEKGGARIWQAWVAQFFLEILRRKAVRLAFEKGQQRNSRDEVKTKGRK